MSSAPIPPPPEAEPELGISLASMLVGEWAREALLSVATNTPRSLQAQLGPSEIGQLCERRLAYRALGTPATNLPDPIKAMFGTGMHLALAEGLARANHNKRFLVEAPVNYRGIPGVVDVHDRYKRRLIDWKTTSVKNVKRYRREGVSVNYRVQTAIYAEGLQAAGEVVEEVCLVFIPRDGDLSDVWAWVGEPDKALADQYIDRYTAIAAKAQAEGAAALPASPSPLCNYCPNYQARAADLAVSCPGKGNPA